MKTCKPPKLLIRAGQLFDRNIEKINKYRQSKNIPPFPQGLLSAKIRLLIPGCETFSPGYGEFAQYRERVRLIQVELEVIEMIMNGNIPAMSVE